MLRVGTIPLRDDQCPLLWDLPDILRDLPDILREIVREIVHPKNLWILR